MYQNFSYCLLGLLLWGISVPKKKTKKQSKTNNRCRLLPEQAFQLNKNIQCRQSFRFYIKIPIYSVRHIKLSTTVAAIILKMRCKLFLVCAICLIPCHCSSCPLSRASQYGFWSWSRHLGRFLSQSGCCRQYLEGTVTCQAIRFYASRSLWFTAHILPP